MGRVFGHWDLSLHSAQASRHLNGLPPAFLRECDNAFLPDKNKASAAPPPALLANVSGPARRARELRSRHFDMISSHSQQVSPVNPQKNCGKTDSPIIYCASH